MEEKMDLLLKNGLVVTENECKRVDIAVKTGKLQDFWKGGVRPAVRKKK